MIGRLKNIDGAAQPLVDCLHDQYGLKNSLFLTIQSGLLRESIQNQSNIRRKIISAIFIEEVPKHINSQEGTVIFGTMLTLDSEQDEQTEDAPEESDDDKTSKGGGSSHTTNNTGSSTQSTNTTQPKSRSNYTSARNGYIATSIARFGNSLSRTFRDRFDEQVEKVPMDVDSRLKREIEAKKKGQKFSV